MSDGSLNGKKILIVDDNMEIIRLVAGNVKSYDEDVEIISSSNGEMAIEAARQEIPDLIIMDWDMPRMNGIEATRNLRNHNETHHIPVVILTGRMTSSEDLKVALEAGATDYVRKPIDFIELRARINTALRIDAQHKAIQGLLKNDLELKDRKLSTTSMLIVEKNALLKEFHNDLSELQKLNKERPQEVEVAIKKMQRRVSNHLEVDHSWNTFKIHFDEVHPNFFEQLKQFNITNKDMKLCAYLRMRMDNKQISRLLNITHASIRTALYRMKKKMKLDDDADLREFILQL